MSLQHVSKLSRILTRADIQFFQGLIGSATLRLFTALRKNEPTLAELRQLLLRMRSEAGLIEDRTSRGALIELLSEEEATRLGHLLGASTTGNLWQNVQRASDSHGAITTLYSFFEVGIPEEDSPERTEPSSIAKAEYPLFSHQRLALFSLIPLLAAGRRRAVLHMPTGSGKTRTAMNLIAEHLRTHSPSIVVWLANSEELCSQAADEFLRSWRNLGNRETGVYRLWGGCSVESEDLKDGLLVASLASVFSRMRGLDPTWAARVGSKTSLVVMDEAHQAIAPSYQLVLEGLTSFRLDTALLGLTATPGRTWNDPGMDVLLADFFDHKKVTLKVEGYPNPVDYLIDEGFLARPVFRNIPYSGSKLFASERLKLEKAMEIPAEILRRLADDDHRSIQIIQQMMDLSTRHQRILLFATTVEHAERLAVLLSGLGVECRSITSRSGPAARRDSIAWYLAPAEGVRVLANYGVLTTGFDAPRTSATLIARPTRSLVLFSQMVGRATRGVRAGGNASAEIVTVVDTSLPGFGNMAEAFNNWEDVW